MLEETGNQAATTSGSFAGFVPPTRNYFMMPNEWTDITADMQSLYDFEYDQLREFAKAKGKGEPLPPRLGNLVKALPEWKQTQVRRKQEKEQDQEAHEHIPGSGSITNWTQARLAGNQPTINYEPLPPVKKIPKDLKKIVNVTSALSPGLQERFRQAREKRQTEA